MDINEAIEKARKELVKLYKGCKISHIRVEEAIYIPANEQWKIAYSFVLYQGALKDLDALLRSNGSWECKVITLHNKDGQLASLTNCTFRVAQYGRVARQKKRPGRAIHQRTRWWQPLVSSFRAPLQAFLVIPGVAVGWATGALAISQQVPDIPTIDETIVLWAYMGGVLVGLVTAVGLYRQASSSKGKCCRCKPAGS